MLVLLAALAVQSPRIVVGTPPALVLQPTPAIEVDGNAQWRARWIGDTVIALIDPGLQTVVEINLRTGRKQVSGARGRGPGEFVNATTPIGDSAGRLLVSDLSLRRIAVFSQQRQVQHTYQYEGMVATLLRWERDTLLAVWTDIRSATSTLGKLWPGPNGALESSPVTPLADALGPNAKIEPGQPIMFAAAVSPTGVMYVADPRTYRIVRVTGREPGVVAAQREIVGRPLTREQAERRTDEVMKQMATESQLAGVLTPAVRADLVRRLLKAPQPVLSPTGLSVDGSERVWVVTTRIASGGTEVDVFCPNGTFLGTVRLRGTVRSLDWRGLKAVAVVEARPEGEEHLGIIDLYQADYHPGQCRTP